MRRTVIREGHRWRMDTTQGWEYCTCLNGCRWVREIVEHSPDVYTYTRDGAVYQPKNVEPMCDPVCP